MMPVPSKKTLLMLIIPALMPLALAACQVPPRTAQVVTSPDKVSLMLAEAADRASSSLQTLAAIEQARAPGVAVQPIVNAPEELQRAMTVHWVGPPEQIMRKLADRASYSFVTLGERPPVPVIVTIDVQNRPVIEILRDIGLQMGVRGDVSVNAQSRVIELHYAPVIGVGG